ncbi:MAG: DNA-binding protein YbiB [Acidiferrobacter sp.]
MTREHIREASTNLSTQNIPEILGAVAHGAKHATDLNEPTAHALFAEWLSGQLAPIAQGALWTAFRLKGESLEELLGFVRATEESLAPIPVPTGIKPVVFPSYNGARRQANLLPLLALLLARAGVPVLIHGSYAGVADETDLELSRHNPNARITTGEILAHLGFPPARQHHDVQDQLQRHHLSYTPLDVLHPQLAGILSLRRQLGVRSSAHIIIKLFNPFRGPAVQCAAVTHPSYLARMQAFFLAKKACALILRGTEGEPVTHAKRRPSLIGIHEGSEREWLPEDRTPLAQIPELPEDRSVAKTCAFIEGVLAGHIPIPPPLRDQLACLLTLSGATPDLDRSYIAIDQSLKPIQMRS